MLLKRINVIALAAVFVVHFGCKENAVGPTPLKDPRTLVFTVDTLAYPDAFQTNIQDIAGTAANNVFAVGFNSTSSAGTMYRFDGKSWKTTGFHMREGGPIIGTVDFSSLLAFSGTNIWFVGDRSRVNPNPPPNFIDSSFILNYDGRTWTEHKVQGGRRLSSVDGNASNDVWACGVYATLLHYNGIQWQKDSIPLSFPSDWFYGLRDIAAVDAQNVYALANAEKVGEFPRFYFLHRMMGRWIIVDSVVARSDADIRWGTVDLWASPSGTLYSAGGVGVYRWDGARWVKMLDSPEPLSRIWGYSDDSFFVGGYRTLLHYNGRDFFRYSNLMNYPTNNKGIWGDGRELFVIGYDGRRSFVYHGR